MRGTSLAACFILALSSAFVAVSSLEGTVSAREREAAADGGARQKKPLTDAQIKQILIDESIAAYEGNCPCPYSTARNGSRCGRRSAYSRPGGAAPLCYAKDVTAEMVQGWREEHPGE